MPRHDPKQRAVAVALVLLGAGLGQRPPHLPSVSHVPSRRAKHIIYDAGTPQDL